MNIRRVFLPSTFLFFMTFNPGAFAGCADDDDPTFEFDEAEMDAKLNEVLEEGTLRFESMGATYQLELNIERTAAEVAASTTPSMFASTAYACGTKERMFAQSAAACATFLETRMPVSGSLSVFKVEDEVVSPIAQDIPVQGDFLVSGSRLDSWWFLLEFEGGEVHLQESIHDEATGLAVNYFDAENLGDSRVDIMGPQGGYGP